MAESPIYIKEMPSERRYDSETRMMSSKNDEAMTELVDHNRQEA